MQLVVKIVGALGIVAVSFFATLWLLDGKVATCQSGRAIVLGRPFQKVADGGFTYSKGLKDIDVLGDSNDAPSRSTLMLCEDGNPIGPAHSVHVDIAKEGRGRYSHWGNSLLFSTSDNSDPNTNGRSYSVVRP